MKRKLLFSAFLLSVSIECGAAYNPRLIYVLEQLRHCRSVFDNAPEVGGPAVGYSGTPHEFYLLYPYVSWLASEADLVAMCRDASPVVRVMAAKCIVNRKEPALASALGALSKDNARLAVFPYGCVGESMTVAEVVVKLKANHDFLGDLKKPSQSPEPTVMSVTPPAAQEARQP